MGSQMCKNKPLYNVTLRSDPSQQLVLKAFDISDERSRKEYIRERQNLVEIKTAFPDAPVV